MAPIKIDTVLLNKIAQLAEHAGELIMSVYQREGGIVAQSKLDDSPLTEADLLSHRYLYQHLLLLAPHIPILSEEGELPRFETRKKWWCYWLIDPLDGTKEFVSRNGEFTVNIALVVDGKPVLGVVYAPVLKRLYKAINDGSSNDGAFCLDLDAGPTLKSPMEVPVFTQNIRDRICQQQPIRILTSRHHGKENIRVLCSQIETTLGSVKTLAIGSSLKMCLIAEGEADLYPRLGPTSEWDTAAAQAIVEAAGGSILDGELKPLRYNQKECILNPDFYVVGIKSGGDNPVELKWLSTLSEFAGSYA